MSILQGKEGGLDLGIGFYPNEWAPGPFLNFEGFIVHIHDPDDETVLIKDNGLSIPIGSTASLRISKETTTFLVHS